MLESKVLGKPSNSWQQLISSMKRCPYGVVADVMFYVRNACTCPANRGLQRKGKCNHIGGIPSVIDSFTQ